MSFLSFLYIYPLTMTLQTIQKVLAYTYKKWRKKCKTYVEKSKMEKKNNNSGTFNLQIYKS